MKTLPKKKKNVTKQIGQWNVTYLKEWGKYYIQNRATLKTKCPSLYSLSFINYQLSLHTHTHTEEEKENFGRNMRP